MKIHRGPTKLIGGPQNSQEGHKIHGGTVLFRSQWSNPGHEDWISYKKFLPGKIITCMKMTGISTIPWNVRHVHAAKCQLHVQNKSYIPSINVRYLENVRYIFYSRYTWNCQVLKCHMAGITQEALWPGELAHYSSEASNRYTNRIWSSVSYAFYTQSQNDCTKD